MVQSVQLSITAIQHVGIPVTDIKVSEVFYTRLGFINVMKAGFLHDNEKGICIMMKQGNIVIELYQLPEKEIQSVRNRKDGHIDHIAFDVQDIDAAFAILKNGGFSIIEKAPVFLDFWEKGCKYFNITGPDGERLEFNQVM